MFYFLHNNGQHIRGQPIAPKFWNDPVTFDMAIGKGIGIVLNSSNMTTKLMTTNDARAYVVTSLAANSSLCLPLSTRGRWPGRETRKPLTGPCGHVTFRDELWVVLRPSRCSRRKAMPHGTISSTISSTFHRRRWLLTLQR